MRVKSLVFAKKEIYMIESNGWIGENAFISLPDHKNTYEKNYCYLYAHFHIRIVLITMFCSR